MSDESDGLHKAPAHQHTGIRNEARSAEDQYISIGVMTRPLAGLRDGNVCSATRKGGCIYRQVVRRTFRSYLLKVLLTYVML